jgi:hypothetical protein
MAEDKIAEKREERMATAEELRNLAAIILKRTEEIEESGR